MVICRYFQSGNCRFGSKCANEHFDIKQILKTDVEAAIKGNQWPLSCFGPFKEKPCLPNFIDDQCYEEIRFLCYEARKQNAFPAFQQQFTQQVMEAQNKMKSLLTLSREVIDLVANLYDGAAPGQKPAAPSNPFSIGSGQPASTSLFGNTSNQANPFASSVLGGGASNAGNIFTNKPASSGGSILGQSAFGNTFSGGAAQHSIFGSTNQQSTAGSFSFAQQQPQQPQMAAATSGGNIFSLNQQQQPATNSIFGVAPQQQQQPQQATGSPFGAANTFGASAVQTNVFGQAAPQPQQQQMSGGNIFTQPGFGQVQPQQQQQAPPPFGATQTQSLFGQQPQQQQAQQPGQGLFGQQPQQQNIFAQQAQAQQQMGQLQQQHQQPPPNANVFGVPQGNIFATQQTQNAGGSFFGNAVQPQQGNVFGQQPNVFQSAPTHAVREEAYSKMEDLTPEEIEAFKADHFVIGRIPTKPPPRELIK